MGKRCIICSEDNVTAGHEETKKHLKNAGLFLLDKYKKKFSENRNGVIVTCTVTPTEYNAEPLLTDKEDSWLEVSVKPPAELRIKFTIKNDNTHSIIFGGAAMLYKKRKQNFTLHNDDVGVGTSAHTIQPKQYFKEQISITFESQAIGVYQIPIYFIFAGAENEQTTVVWKEMVVCVNKEKKLNQKVDSPYTKEVVYAERIVSSPAAVKRLENNKYLIPSKNHWAVFEHLESCRNNNDGGGGSLTDEQDTLLENIRCIFESGPTHNNYVPFFRHLLWCNETAIARNVKNYKLSRVTLLPHSGRKNSYALTVPGLAEKRPSIMPGDFVHVRPHGQKKILFESVITDIEDTCAVFGEFAAEFTRYYGPEAKFDIRFFMSRVPLERMHEAVANVQSSGAMYKVYPRKTNPPQIKAIPKEKYFNAQVAANPEQCTVVEHVVGGSSGAAPYLLFGPPGTGKTVTIVEAILQLARDPNNRILVCTESNMAADHVASKIALYRQQFKQEREFILRANAEFRKWEPMPQCLREYSNGHNRKSFSPVSIKRFLNNRIMITTLIHAAKFARELKNKKYDRKTTHVFIDEAAQASEPAALVPVCGLLAPAGTLVLAGDPQQLGPVCISREAKDRGLGVSLMKRLKDNCHLYSDENHNPNFFMMLKTNFRCHADILSIPNELFYHGELKTQAEPDRISAIDILGKKETSHAIHFHGVESKEEREGKSPSFFNDTEAAVVQNYAVVLVNNHKVLEKDIGVVTPYIKQVSCIKDRLEYVGLTGIEVGTVEAFQGREKRVIILSCVRANCDFFAHDAKFKLGFIDSAERFNVAITRAIAKLIVIGNPLCLRKDTKWSKYMQKCREFGTYAGFDAGVEETDADREEVLEQIAPIMRAIKEMNVSE